MKAQKYFKDANGNNVVPGDDMDSNDFQPDVWKKYVKRGMVGEGDPTKPAKDKGGKKAAGSKSPEA